MNIGQLERIRILLSSIQAEIKTDSSGSGGIFDCLAKLEFVLMEELKNQVWGRYLEAKKQ